jgi:DNA-binding transcriptional regulator YhcF (GntR family)
MPRELSTDEQAAPEPRRSQSSRMVNLRGETIIRLLTEGDLGDLVMLAAVSAHAPYGTCRASIPTLADWLQIHPRTARKRMNALVELGYVKECPVRGHERASREIVEPESGQTVQVEAAGIDMDDSFGLLLLLMAIGLPHTGPLDELARAAGVSRVTFNRLLDRLIERKFVTIERKSRAQFFVVPAGTLLSPKKSAHVRHADSIVDYSSGKWAKIAQQLLARRAERRG